MARAKPTAVITPTMAAQMGLIPKRKAPRTAFKRGQPRPANAGRKKGVPNKITTDMKVAVMEAFNRLGGADFLVRIGKSKAPANRRAMLQVFGKMLPLEVVGSGGGPVKTESIVNFYLPNNSRGTSGGG